MDWQQTIEQAHAERARLHSRFKARRTKMAYGVTLVQKSISHTEGERARLDLALKDCDDDILRRQEHLRMQQADPAQHHAWAYHGARWLAVGIGLGLIGLILTLLDDLPVPEVGFFAGVDAAAASPILGAVSAALAALAAWLCGGALILLGRWLRDGSRPFFFCLAVGVAITVFAALGTEIEAQIQAVLLLPHRLLSLMLGMPATLGRTGDHALSVALLGNGLSMVIAVGLWRLPPSTSYRLVTQFVRSWWPDSTLTTLQSSRETLRRQRDAAVEKSTMLRTRDLLKTDRIEDEYRRDCARLAEQLLRDLSQIARRTDRLGGIEAAREESLRLLRISHDDEIEITQKSA